MPPPHDPSGGYAARPRLAGCRDIEEPRPPRGAGVPPAHGQIDDNMFARHAH
jgi:hypothetical protein